MVNAVMSGSSDMAGRSGAQNETASQFSPRRSKQGQVHAGTRRGPLST